ncbi:hypothetical protein ABZO31_25745 [Streptomyces sp. HUAS MG47]|uniref:hypothetical protein n=1 Tax=Streptomyces solicamelliae TaxID=3231716 RepID=UPI003877E2AA
MSAQNQNQNNAQNQNQNQNNQNQRQNNQNRNNPNSNSNRNRNLQQRQNRNAAPAPHSAARQSEAERILGPLKGFCEPPFKRTSAEIAAVLMYRNGGHRIVWPDRHEDTNKPLLGSPYTYGEVQLGRHVTEFELALPAAGDGVFFQAIARVQWEVEDPYLVVTQQVRDVAELLHDDLLDGLRSVSRRFRLTEAQRADEAVRDEIATGRLALGRDLGLRTRVRVFVDLDQGIREEVFRRDAIDVTMQTHERVAEANRRKEEADRRLIADRARELEEMFRRGSMAEIAHHMAMNPDKQWEIRRELQHEKREGQADFLAVFNRLLDTGVLERHDIGEPMYQVLEFLRQSTGTVLGGVAGHVLNPPRSGGRSRRELDEGSRPEPISPPWDDEERGDDAYGDDAYRDRDRDRDGHVYEPTRVQSSAERDRDRRRDRDRDSGRRSHSEDFDDWDEE